MSAGRQPSGPVIRAEQVGVRFGASQILSDIELDVSAGSWVTVVGPNAAGKSTLLRVLAGLVPYTGRVFLHGVESRDLPVRARARTVAAVPQLPTVPLGVRVADYVLLGRTPHLRPLQRAGRQDAEVVARVLDQLELTDFADRMLTAVSGGELQRVFLARALAQQPTLLLLDEPTSALDIGHQQDVLNLVDRLRAESDLTVLSSMHDLSLAGSYSDRLVMLDRGRISAQGTASEVLTAETVEGIYRARVHVLPPGSWPGQRGPTVLPVRTE